MERLTERAGEGQAIPRMDLKNNGHQRCMERLAEYEDLEEQGKLLKLCVPIGSLVYEPYQFMGNGAWEIDAHKIRLEDLDKIGKSVFLTMEEAEAALKELEGKEE